MLRVYYIWHLLDITHHTMEKLNKAALKMFCIGVEYVYGIFVV